MKNRKFRIVETWNKYITTSKVVKDKIYAIQEYKRFWWIFGKKKWRGFWVEEYDCPSLVYFDKLKEAEGYLKCLRDYYNGN